MVPLLLSSIRFRLKYKFPNVVPGWPIVGNFFDVPYPTGMWALDKAQKYGEMYVKSPPSRVRVVISKSSEAADT